MTSTKKITRTRAESYAFIIAIVLISIVGLTLVTALQGQNQGLVISTGLPRTSTTGISPSPSPAPTTGPGVIGNYSFCGDQTCDAGENKYYCPSDCAHKPVFATYPGSGGATLTGYFCSNASCPVSSMEPFPLVPSGGAVKAVWAPDGNPIFLHQTITGFLSGLYITKCLSPDCATVVTNEMESPLFTSMIAYDMAITEDNLPWLYYVAESGINNGKLVQCTSPDCSTFKPPILIGDGSSIIIGADGFPVFTYGYDNYAVNGKYELHLVKCDDSDCNFTQDTVIDSWDIAPFGGTSFPHARLALSPENVLYIAYNDGSAHLNFVRCYDNACSFSTPVIESDIPIKIAVISFLTNGSPIIGYLRAPPFQTVMFEIAVCSNEWCSDYTTHQLPGKTFTWGENAGISLTMPSDGKPIIMYSIYQDPGSQSIVGVQIVKCADTACQSFVLKDIVDGVGYESMLGT